MGARVENGKFYSVEVTDIDSIVEFRNHMHGRLNIFVNNAGQYFKPFKDPIEHFRQVQKTMISLEWTTMTFFG